MLLAHIVLPILPLLRRHTTCPWDSLSGGNRYREFRVLIFLQAFRFERPLFRTQTHLILITSFIFGPPTLAFRNAPKPHLHHHRLALPCINYLIITHLQLYYYLHLVDQTCFLLKRIDEWEYGKAKSLQLSPAPHLARPARPMVSILPSKGNPRMTIRFRFGKKGTTTSVKISIPPMYVRFCIWSPLDCRH